ncbi:MAG TPA: hypothetical protein VH913_02175 [Hyphomicrobiaceae bacterium]
MDALKYKALLLLNRGELDNAERAFDRLRQRANGQENACYRADAYLGLATVKSKRGAENYAGALQSLATALSNINMVPSAEQHRCTFSEIYSLQAEIYSSTGWSSMQPAITANARKCCTRCDMVAPANQVPDRTIA